MRLPAGRAPLTTLLCLLSAAPALLAFHAGRAEAYNPVLARPVLVIGDGLDWSTGKDADGHRLRPGDKVTTTLRIGYGIPGQSGYAVSSPGAAHRRPPRFVAGRTQTIDLPGRREGAATVRLPFPFPFGGLRERTASVSSDGRISFGSPAWDSWEGAGDDARGAAAVVGGFERGIMPYWAASDGADRVKMVTPAGGDSVAFQWRVGSRGGPPRAFQLILFRDGRFRFDYPGRDAPGGHKAFIGYSLGTGRDGYRAVAADTRSVPAGSVLFSPRPVTAAKPLPAGRSVLDLPPGAVPNLPRECKVQNIGEGLPGPIVCWIPALAPGAEVARSIAFKAPSAPPSGARKGVASGALGYSAAYAAGSVMATDDDEVSLSAHHPDGPNWISVLPLYSGRSEAGPQVEPGAPPVVGQWAEFSAAVTVHVGKVNDAVVTVKAPPTVFDFRVSAYGSECGPASAENVITCSWSNADENYLQLTALMRPAESAVGSPLTLQFGVTSPGLEPNSATASSPAVIASP